MGRKSCQLKTFFENFLFQNVVGASVTRLDDLFHFGQLFKACGNNYFAQIAHILDNFCKGFKNFHFSSEIIFGQLFIDIW